METKYYIYHIPTYVHTDGKVGKIGVSKKPIGRAAKQSDEWEVLETHTDIMEVSRREIELQKQYGYKVDKNPYWQMVLNTTKRSPTPKAQMERMGILAISSKLRVVNITKFNKSKRKLTYEDAQFIREVRAKKQYNQKQLAEMYGVSTSTISLIISNRNYITP